MILLKFLGTTIPELIWSCCAWYPNQNTIDELLKLDDTTDMEQLVQSLFNYENRGTTCLYASLMLMGRNYGKTKQLPNSSIKMYNEIESLFIYLLELAEQNNVDMDRAINSTDETGQSIIELATLYSENISHELINRNVKVQRINSDFITPLFIVGQSLIFDFLKSYLVSLFTTNDD